MVYEGSPDYKLPIVVPYQLPLSRLERYFRSVTAIMETGVYRTEGQWSLEVSDLLRGEMELSTSQAVVPMRSGTDALIAALLMAGVGPGDHVAAPDLAYHAVGAVIAQVGAIPVWIDIDPCTWNIDLVDLSVQLDRQHISAAVIVDNYGTPCERAAAASLCRAHGVPSILDACESLGASLGPGLEIDAVDWICVSFSFTKPIHAAGAGGALCGRSSLMEEYSSDARVLLHQRRLPELNAAYLVMAWSDLRDVVRGLREVYERYWAHFSNYGMVGQPDGGAGTRIHAPFLLPSGRDRVDRDDLIAHLTLFGIQARPYFESQARLFGGRLCRVSCEIADRVVCLPTGAGFSEQNTDCVISRVLEWLGRQVS